MRDSIFLTLLGMQSVMLIWIALSINKIANTLKEVDDE